MIGLVLSALAPIVFVVGLGWLANATRLMPDDASRTLALFVVKIALPMSLFLAAAQADPAELLRPAFLLSLAGGLLGAYVFGFAVARLVFGHTRAQGALQALACSFPNMAYCGPPVLMASVGAGGLLAIVAGNLIVTLIAVPVTLVLLAGESRAGSHPEGVLEALTHAVRQPLVFLPVAGTLLSVTGIRLPSLVVTATDEIGRAAAGTALFTLGLILARTRFALDREIVFNVLVKNVLQPLILLGLGSALGLSGPALKMTFLIGVLPSATEVPTLSIASGVYTDKAAATTLISTLAAVLSISIGVALCGARP